MQAVFTEVATALNAMAASEDDATAQLPSPAPAPQRFAAAVQAALADENAQAPRYSIAHLACNTASLISFLMLHSQKHVFQLQCSKLAPHCRSQVRHFAHANCS